MMKKHKKLRRLSAVVPLVSALLTGICAVKAVQCYTPAACEVQAERVDLSELEKALETPEETAVPKKKTDTVKKKKENKTTAASAGSSPAVTPAASPTRAPSLTRVDEPSEYRDGTYTGTGTGFGGPLTVQVTVEGGKLKAVEIVSHSDGDEYIRRAQSLISLMISGQTTNVDAASGATYSSAGLIEAVRNALSQAKTGGQENNNIQSDGSKNSEEKPVKGKFPYHDGIYYGTAEGYLGDITVAVVIEDKKIVTIIITESEDDETYLGRADAVRKNVIDSQSTKVDTVSGATYSSKGILKAIKNALKAAKKASRDEAATPTPAVKPTPELTVEPTLKPTVEPTPMLTPTPEPGTEQQYVDGTYYGEALCRDVGGYFDNYTLSLNVTVTSDTITAITDVLGKDGDPENEQYIRRAEKGLVPLILEKNGVEGIDAVTRATRSSKALLEAVQNALEAARKASNIEGRKSQ